MPPLLLLAVGLVTLVAGAEVVVRGGSRLAARLGISPVVVGLTVVSVGTSAPELAVGIDASLRDVGSLALGNIAGTNMVNLLLILGLSAAISPVVLRAETFRHDLPMMILAALALLVLSLDHELSRADGLLLLAMAVVYTVVIVRLSLRESAAVRAEYAAEYGVPRAATSARHVVGDLVVLVVGIAVVVIGADWLVDGASAFASSIGVSDALIGLTIVAIGTSAPELVTTLVSTVRGDRDLAIGNLVGSSVYNVALIMGATAVVAPVRVSQTLVRVDLPIMTAVTILCFPVFLSGRRVSRTEGTLFVLAYLAYLTYLVVART